MPFVGFGALHILVALFFAVHAIRSGRELYWIVILFMFPMLGSVVYFFAIYLPETRIEQHISSAGSQLARALDPGRELRESMSGPSTSCSRWKQVTCKRRAHYSAISTSP